MSNSAGGGWTTCCPEKAAEGLSALQCWSDYLWGLGRGSQHEGYFCTDTNWYDMICRVLHNQALVDGLARAGAGDPGVMIGMPGREQDKQGWKKAASSL